MIYLLDVNILIALIDPLHVHAPLARQWFEREGRRGWATCPITENGLMRIVGHARYPNGGSPVLVAESLLAMRRLPNHHFWPDNLSLVDAEWVDTSRLLTSAQVTDTYLLALAVAHGGRLATFDRNMVTAAVAGGDQARYVIPMPNDLQ